MGVGGRMPRFETRKERTRFYFFPSILHSYNKIMLSLSKTLSLMPRLGLAPTTLRLLALLLPVNGVEAGELCV